MPSKVVEKDIERGCFKCGQPVRVRAALGLSGKLYRYIEAIEGMLCEYDYFKATRRVVCDACLPLVKEELIKKGRGCKFCGEAILTYDDANYCPSDTEDTERYSCNKAECLQKCAELEEEKIKAENIRKAKLEREEKIFFVKRDAWVRGHPPPYVSPVFKDVDNGLEDKSLLLFIRSLDHSQYNRFMIQLHLHIKHSTWKAFPYEFDPSEIEDPSSFAWGVHFNCDLDKKGFDIECIQVTDHAGESVSIPLPLPLCVREWVTEGGVPLFEV